MIAAFGISLFALSQSAFAFPTGKYECISERAGANGEKAVATVQISKLQMKSTAGQVELPYMDYKYDDQNGNQVHTKGIAQVSKESLDNYPEIYSIQLDANGFRISFKGDKVATRVGECHKVN